MTTHLGIKDFVIGVLTISAVVLLAAFLIVTALPPRQVMAATGAGQSAGGAFATSTVRPSHDVELLTILDIKSHSMNVYNINSLGRIELVQNVDIERLAENFHKVSRGLRTAQQSQQKPQSVNTIPDRLKKKQ